MVGTGALAPHLVAAHAAVRPIRQTRVWGRDPEKAAALAARLAEAGLDAAPVAELEEAVAAADIITCATLAKEPLIRGAWLGRAPISTSSAASRRRCARQTMRRSPAPGSTSIPMRRCDEAGDIVQPLRSGHLARERIVGDLFGLTRGTCPGPARPGRDHAVQIGRHRARRPRRRTARGQPSRFAMKPASPYAVHERRR